MPVLHRKNLFSKNTVRGKNRATGFMLESRENRDAPFIKCSVLDSNKNVEVNMQNMQQKSWLV